jgi:hypothetical protein
VPLDAFAPIKLLDATKADFSLSASKEFKNLIGVANQGKTGVKGIMTYAHFDKNTGVIASGMTAPDTSKINCHGTPAIN